MAKRRDTSARYEGSRPSTPEVTGTKRVYEGRVIKLRIDEIRLSDGCSISREVIEHPGAVVIVALDEWDHVYLVEQYRHPIGRLLLELPAGTLEPGEEPLSAAQRELREEVGVLAAQWAELGSFYTTPGFCDEVLHVFLARDLTHTECDPDDDEELRLVRLARTELLGPGVAPLLDGKSLAALHLLREAESQDGNKR